MKILITSGGTQEPIDQVRRITNTSTGKTGLFIAESLQKEGHQIYFLRAEQAPSFCKAEKEFSFLTSNDLETQIYNILSRYNIDIVIQCAAVSDFCVDKLVINGELFHSHEIEKISSQDQVEIVLKNRPKIISKIKYMTENSAPIVIGFKLTNTADEHKRRDSILKLSTSPDIDFVIHNDLTEISEEQHPTTIYFQDKILFQGQTKNDLTNNLQKLIHNLKEAHSYDLMS